MGHRPPGTTPPAHLSKSPPVPQPAPPQEPVRQGATGEDPTRYGDWTRKGIAVDF